MRSLIEKWRCRRLAARLVDCAEGTLAPNRERRVERHLQECARCAAALAALREVPQTLRATTDAAHAGGPWERQRQEIMRAIRQLPEHSPARRWIPAFDLRLALPVLAAVAIAVAGYQSLWHPAQPALRVAEQFEVLDPDDPALLAEMAEILFSSGDLVAVGQLVDGGVVGSMSAAEWIAVDEMAIPLDLDDLDDGEIETLHELVG